ncbi:PucR family transcriptional regulator ligand-binding domain-containing protein [Nocardioides sp. SYSU DS0663]|uniref:PucR family transcriptional regulator n=1 Tax=Nocardioides sp. SYSU DS0663 TaxID=3416445 RepID=UPI003F4BB027
MADAGLGLVVRVGHEGLDQEIARVAVSELPDPTPWLGGAELLLTSGMWLTAADDPTGAADAWAERVRGTGALAVGFGLDPWFELVPEEMLRAARRHRLTLVEVPRRTPFVALHRRVAELLAAEARRDEANVIRGQQKLARAAVRGSVGVIETLAAELRTSVVVLDAAHRSSMAAGPAVGLPTERRLPELARAAETRRQRSMLSEVDGEAVYLVPMGSHQHRVGTLCVVGSSSSVTSLSLAGLVGTGAALLTVLLPTVDTAVGSVVVELLMSGERTTAQRICDVADISLPDPLVAIAFTGPDRESTAMQCRALGAWHVPAGQVAAACSVVLGSAEFASARVPGLLAGGRVRAGVSSAQSWETTQRAVREAIAAADLAPGDGHLARFEDSARSRLEVVLSSSPARSFATDLLAPLDDAPDRDLLLASAAAWLQEHGRWEPAAQAAGVHRETLRARIARLATRLELDLGSAEDRLALSLALTTLVPPPGGPGSTGPSD